MPALAMTNNHAPGVSCISYYAGVAINTGAGATELHTCMLR